jgi:hypothetical protein
MLKKIAGIVALVLTLGMGAQPASALDGQYTVGIEEGGLSDAATSHMTRFHNGGSDATCYTLASGDCSIPTLVSQNDDVWFQAPMKHCESATQDYCIASVQIYHDGSAPTDATFEYEAFSGLPKVQPDPTHGIGETGQPLVYRSATETSTQGSPDFMVQAGIHYTLRAPDFQPEISEFKMSAFPVHQNDADHYDIQKFQPGTRVAMQVRVPKEVGGWFKGRLGDAHMSISVFDDADYLLNVDALNVSIPYAQAAFTESQLTAFKAANPGQFDWMSFCGNCGVGMESDSPFGLLEALRPYAHDTSPDLKTGWYLTSMKGAVSQQCEASGVGLVGLVATNASAYTGRAPQLDSSGLKYQVASFHYLPDGTSVAQGSYDLLIRDDVARCIYGLPNSGDLQARISVTENGTASAATTTFEDEGGFVHFSAQNFHFSAPVISAALTMAKPSGLRLGAEVLGSKRVGELLSVVPAGVPSGSKIKYRWLRAGLPIAKATASTYRLTADDLGKSIQATIVVTPPHATAVVHKSLETLPILAGHLKLTPTPVVSGTAAFGSTLRASTGTWDAGVAHAYLWMMNGKPIAGATAATYKPKRSDIGKAVSVAVAGQLVGYLPVTRVSGVKTISLGTLPAIRVSKIQGSLKVGSTLKAKAPSVLAGAKLAYQWMRSGKPIARATKLTYAVTKLDRHKVLSLKVSAALAGYKSAAVLVKVGPVK